MSKKRSHKFVVRVSFTHRLTRREALEAMRESGQMGKSADDYYGIAGPNDRYLDGQMKVTAISLAKTTP